MQQNQIPLPDIYKTYYNSRIKCDEAFELLHDAVLREKLENENLKQINEHLTKKVQELSKKKEEPKND